MRNILKYAESLEICDYTETYAWAGWMKFDIWIYILISKRFRKINWAQLIYF